MVCYMNNIFSKNFLLKDVSRFSYALQIYTRDNTYIAERLIKEDKDSRGITSGIYDVIPERKSGKKLSSTTEYREETIL